MYILVPISIKIEGELKGNLDPDFTKVEQIKGLAKELGLNCELEMGTPKIEGVDGSSIAFPEDAPAPEVTTIDGIDEVIAVLSAHRYIPAVQQELKAAIGEADHAWVRDHLGYFAHLEPKYRDAIMASWNPLGPNRPKRKDAAKVLGVSVSVMNNRSQDAFRQVVKDLEKKRNEYISRLTPQSVISESVAVLDFSVDKRVKIRQAGIKTVGDLAELTFIQFVAKMGEDRNIRNSREYYERQLMRWGLRFKDEDPS